MCSPRYEPAWDQFNQELASTLKIFGRLLTGSVAEDGDGDSADGGWSAGAGGRRRRILRFRRLMWLCIQAGASSLKL
jgi:hypothetical protein